MKKLALFLAFPTFLGAALAQESKPPESKPPCDLECRLSKPLFPPPSSPPGGVAAGKEQDLSSGIRMNKTIEGVRKP